MTVRVLVVHPYWAHYRRPIIEELLALETAGLEIFLFAGKETDQRLKTFDRKELPERWRGRWIAGRNHWFARRLLWQRGLIPQMAKGRYEAVIFLANPYYVSTWVAAIIARVAGTHVLMWTHGILRKENGIKAIVRLSFYRIAHDLLLYGHRARSLLAESGLPLERLHVIYNSLDFEAQRTLVSSCEAEGASVTRSESRDDAIRIMYIGRVIPGKQIEVLLRAVKILRDRRVPAELVIVGDGSATQHYEDTATALGVGQCVRFAGGIYEEREIAAVMSSADICVCPGPAGLTVMHAMGYGLPVLTHDDFDEQKPESEAIVPDETGDFYRKGDAVDLADLVIKWANKLAIDRAAVKTACVNRIAACYTPRVQASIIQAVLNSFRKRRALEMTR